MPYDIESHQQRKLTETGSLHIFGDRDHIGHLVYVSQSYHDERQGVIWRNVWRFSDMDHLASYAPANCFATLQ